MLCATTPAPHTGGRPMAPGLRTRAASQCRRYAKFGAQTNQAVRRTAAVHCTTMVRSRYSLDLDGADCSTSPRPPEDFLTPPLDLGATPCLQIDSEYSASISGPAGSRHEFAIRCIAGIR